MASRNHMALNCRTDKNKMLENSFIKAFWICHAFEVVIDLLQLIRMANLTFSLDAGTCDLMACSLPDLLNRFHLLIANSAPVSAV